MHPKNGTLFCGSHHRSGDHEKVRHPESLRFSGLYRPPPAAEHPNAYMTLPMEFQNDVIIVLDAQGRILMDHWAVENGLSELDLHELPAGLYKAVLRKAGLSTTFSIVR